MEEDMQSTINTCRNNQRGDAQPFTSMVYNQNLHHLLLAKTCGFTLGLWTKDSLYTISKIV